MFCQCKILKVLPPCTKDFQFRFISDRSLSADSHRLWASPSAYLPTCRTSSYLPSCHRGALVLTAHQTEAPQSYILCTTREPATVEADTTIWFSLQILSSRAPNEFTFTSKEVTAEDIACWYGDRSTFSHLTLLGGGSLLPETAIPSTGMSVT